jgi:hypothetical protein
MDHTGHSVIQLSKRFPQDWSLSLAENGVPKLAIILKEVLRVAGASDSLRQVIGMVKVGWGKVTVRRFEGQRDKGKLSSAISMTFCHRQRFHDRPLYRLMVTVPSFSRASSASRTGWRLISNLSAKSTSTKRSSGLKTSSRIAPRILLTTRRGAFFGILRLVCVLVG